MSSESTPTASGKGALRVLLSVTSFVFIVVGMKLAYGAMEDFGARPLERAATGIFGLFLMIAASGVLYWARPTPSSQRSSPPPPPATDHASDDDPKRGTGA